MGEDEGSKAFQGSVEQETIGSLGASTLAHFQSSLSLTAHYSLNGETVKVSGQDEIRETSVESCG